MFNSLHITQRNSPPRNEQVERRVNQIDFDIKEVAEEDFEQDDSNDTPKVGNDPPGESIVIRRAKDLLDNFENYTPAHKITRAIKPKVRNKPTLKVTETKDQSEEDWDDSANADISHERDTINIVTTFKKKSRNHIQQSMIQQDKNLYYGIRNKKGQKGLIKSQLLPSNLNSNNAHQGLQMQSSLPIAKHRQSVMESPRNDQGRMVQIQERQRRLKRLQVQRNLTNEFLSKCSSGSSHIQFLAAGKSLLEEVPRNNTNKSTIKKNMPSRNDFDQSKSSDNKVTPKMRRPSKSPSRNLINCLSDEIEEEEGFTLRKPKVKKSEVQQTPENDIRQSQKISMKTIFNSDEEDDISESELYSDAEENIKLQKVEISGKDSKFPEVKSLQVSSQNILDSPQTNMIQSKKLSSKRMKEDVANQDVTGTGVESQDHTKKFDKQSSIKRNDEISEQGKDISILNSFLGINHNKKLSTKSMQSSYDDADNLKSYSKEFKPLNIRKIQIEVNNMQRIQEAPKNLEEGSLQIQKFDPRKSPSNQGNAEPLPHPTGNKNKVEFNFDQRENDEESFSIHKSAYKDKVDSDESSCGAFRCLKEDPPKNFEELIYRARSTANSLLMLQEYLSMFELPCYKYHFTVGGAPVTSDNYHASFGLSKDFKTIIIHNFKPEQDYKEEQELAEREKHAKKMDKLQAMYERQQRINQGEEVTEKSKESESSSSDDGSDLDLEKSEDSVIGDIGLKKKKKNKKHKNVHVQYNKGQSGATIEIDEIESFVYGPTSSRFWAMRKHINSTTIKLDPFGNVSTQLPFYAWECLSLNTKDQKRTIDLVFPKENHLMIVLHYLILAMRTVDGIKGSGTPYLEYRLKQQSVGKQNQHRRWISKKWELAAIDRYNFQLLSEKIAMKFKILKIRMKISYIAFSKNITIHELFIKSIYETYYQRKRKGLIKYPWPKVFKYGVLKQILKEEDDESSDDGGGGGCYKDLNQSVQDHANRFPVTKTIAQGVDKNNCDDIFRDLLCTTDLTMPTNQLIQNYVSFKFRKSKIIRESRKIKLLMSMRWFQGPVSIILQQKLIELDKQLFSLLLERGQEGVMIPESLQQNKYPVSFKFYDPIINIVKDKFKGTQKDFSILKKSVGYAFDQKYETNSLFRQKAEDGAPKLKFKLLKKTDGNLFDFMNSMHCPQVQSSKYLKIDEDFVAQSEWLKRDLERNGENLNQFQQEQRLFEQLGQVNVLYLNRAFFKKERAKVLQIKRKFYQQVNNLKEKGQHLQLMGKIHGLVGNLDKVIYENQYEDDHGIITPLSKRSFAEDQQAEDIQQTPNKISQGSQGQQNNDCAEILKFDQSYQHSEPIRKCHDDLYTHKQKFLRLSRQNTYKFYSQISEAFDSRFLASNKFNQYKAIKAQKMEILDQAHILSMMRNEMRLENQLAYIKDDLKCCRCNDEMKINVIDKLIEIKIRYFKPDYDLNRGDIYYYRHLVKDIDKVQKRILAKKKREEQEAKNARVQLIKQRTIQSRNQSSNLLTANSNRSKYGQSAVPGVLKEFNSLKISPNQSKGQI